MIIDTGQVFTQRHTTSEMARTSFQDFPPTYSPPLERMLQLT